MWTGILKNKHISPDKPGRFYFTDAKEIAEERKRILIGLEDIIGETQKK